MLSKQLRKREREPGRRANSNHKRKCVKQQVRRHPVSSMKGRSVELRKIRGEKGKERKKTESARISNKLEGALALRKSCVRGKRTKGTSSHRKLLQRLPRRGNVSPRTVLIKLVEAWGYSQNIAPAFQPSSSFACAKQEAIAERVMKS